MVLIYDGSNYKQLSVRTYENRQSLEWQDERQCQDEKSIEIRTSRIGVHVGVYHVFSGYCQRWREA